MRNDFESNYLAHHGILGMKWGHKNGPPYPLDASDHSAAEKKAGYKKSLGGGRNEDLYDRKKMTRKEKRTIKKNYSSVGENYKKVLNDKEINDQIKNTDEYKRMDEHDQEIRKAYNQLQKEHPGAQLLVTKDYKDEYTKRLHELNIKTNDITVQNISKLASAKLKDLNIEETKQTREYVEKLLKKDLANDRKLMEKEYKEQLKK